MGVRSWDGEGWKCGNCASLQGLPAGLGSLWGWGYIWSLPGEALGCAHQARRFPSDLAEGGGGKVGVKPVPHLLWGKKKASFGFFPSASSAVEQPRLWQGWNGMRFTLPPNPNHSMAALPPHPKSFGFPSLVFTLLQPLSSLS